MSKLFGDDPKRASRLLAEGRTKDEILEQTGVVVAVDDVTFDIERGEIFVVMGLSGSGKSTLIRLLNRLLEPTSGAIFLEGEDITRVSDARLRELRRSKLSMVFQHFGLFPHRTVIENIEYGLKLQGVRKDERRRRAGEALERVGLSGWADTKPANLSGGMQQRVGLARALATDAEILLMDEAFSALDPLIRREMQDELLQIQQQLDKTIVFITHDLNEALKLGDRTAIMRDGAIVQIGTAEEIVSQPQNDYVLEFTRDVDRSRVLTVSAVMRQPDTLREGEGVRSAVARMRSVDADYMMLVDRERRPIGVVLEEDVGRALRAGETRLRPLAQQDFAVVSPDELLVDVYPRATEGRCLVALDEQGRFAGVLEQLDLIGALAMTPRGPGDDGNGAGAPAADGARGTPVDDAAKPMVGAP